MGLMYFDIPFTIWRRGQSLPENTQRKMPKGEYQLVFDADTNPLGNTTHKNIGESFDAFGYSGIVKTATYNVSGKSLTVRYAITATPNGNAGTVIQIPISAIVIAVLTIVGGIVGIALLSKFQRVISLPIIPIILAVIIVWKFAPYLKKAKRLTRAA